MRIVLFTQHFAPDFEGGTESVVRAQARELAARGHELRVVSGTDSPHTGVDRRAETVDGTAVCFLPHTRDEPYDLPLVRPRLAALIDQEVRGADVVHVHHWSTLTGSLVRDRGTRVPVFVTLHDLFTSCPRFFRVPKPPVEQCPEPGDVQPCMRCLARDSGGAPEHMLRGWLVERLRGYRAELAAAQRVLAPSRAHAERLGALLALDAGRIEVLPHGLSRPLSRSPAARAWDGTGPLRVLHLGHRSEVKGTRDLIQALGALPQGQRARVELVLLGAEVEPGFDQDLRRVAGELSLHFAGAYDLDHVQARVAELGAVHLAALPSRVEESYGLVVDEALALGLPVWVSDRGAPKERVSGAGCVLPASDPGAWTRAFGDLLARPELLAAQRSALPEGQRTAADAARDLEALYTESLKVRR